MRASYPTKNAVKDVAVLVAEALDLDAATGAAPPATEYPLPKLRGHPAYWAEERRKLLRAMMDDPTASPKERFLAAAILKA